MDRRPGHALAVLLLVTGCTSLDPSVGRDSSVDPVEAGPSMDGALAPGQFGDAGDSAVATGGGTGGADSAVAPGSVDTGLGTPCTGEGTSRCAAGTAGARQVCMSGAWAASEACPTGQICQQKEGAAPGCQAVAEVCKGSAGAAVCDGQGTLFSCNADGTVAAQQTCGSPKLCQLGLTTKQCAACVPNTEFKCTGSLLEVCAPDGQSFMRKEMCATEALCNKVAGMCTSGVCAAGKIACSGNTLTECNADGSAFKSQMACPVGSTCDEMGADCNVCEPGMKKCENGMVMTCDALGHAFTASACPGSQHCVGAGQCAACAGNDDCSAMTSGCKVGVCGTNNMCSAQNAAGGAPCTATGNKPGTCSSGSCVCTPQCNGKQCGDDGCGGQCPSRCSLFQTCSNSQCVDCTSNLECPGSSDGCLTGVCSGGKCSTKAASSTTRCTSGGSAGTCSNGTCVVCVRSCQTDTCGSDGCGGTCSCGSGKSCFSGVCQVPQWGICRTNTIQSNECGGSNAGGYSCGTFGTGSNLFCVPRPNGSSCPFGTVNFLGYCVVSCTPPPAGSCASPFARCEPNPAPTISDLPGICIR